MGGVRVAPCLAAVDEQGARSWRNPLLIAALVAAAVLLAGCVDAGSRRAGYCGLVRTVDGFEPVQAVRGIGCSSARTAVAALDRGERGQWDCSRAMHARFELDCRRPGEELQILERSPGPAHRHDGEVVLANWAFRLVGVRIEGRRRGGGWIDLSGAPFCEPEVPREALLALRLRPLTPSGGCFALPRPVRP